MIESFEGCALMSYQDIKGVWTIGFGHTGPDVHENLVWTPAQAATALAQDLGMAEAGVRDTRVPLTQHQFDALVSLAYNIGIHAFANSSLVALLKNGEPEAAAMQFLRWSHVNGQVVPGLLRRRRAEMDWFETEDT